MMDGFIVACLFEITTLVKMATKIGDNCAIKRPQHVRHFPVIKRQIHCVACVDTKVENNRENFKYIFLMNIINRSYSPNGYVSTDQGFFAFK